MKLFVWNNPYPVSWGSSLVFAVAETEDAAREVAKTAKAYSFGEYENEHGRSMVVLGAPIRVLDLPCAEWHEWSE